MRALSKSKLPAFRQCPKRHWHEIHCPDLRDDSEAMEARFRIGYAVGDIARRLYDADGKEVLVYFEKEGFAASFNCGISGDGCSNDLKLPPPKQKPSVKH